MSESSPRRSLPKRILLVIGGLFAFILLFAVAIRITVYELFSGIAQSRVSGLSASEGDVRSMWSSGGSSVDFAAIPAYQKGSPEQWIFRSADLRARSSTFEQSVAALHQVVAAHHGYLEDLRTQSRSGYGRILSANVSVPSSDFEASLSDLKSLGRIEAIAESGEDSAVKLAAASRHLAAAQTNLSRLQKLQRERKGELRDAVALEKDIAQANEAVVEAERQNQGLVSIVAQAHIRLMLVEDYRAPLQTNLAGVVFQLRNSMVEGIGAIFSSAALVLGVLFEFGLPFLFWAALLFIPARLAWRRFRRAHVVVPALP